ncbi:MAG: CaiB/BaiF CoA-transferase family protein [Acidimicrobiales bacterium]|jgi:alpha-methylacyl-CoA racemase|nr:CaiB/BaiF CoA-transferase family protein [Acidimicrobiales bacterium]
MTGPLQNIRVLEISGIGPAPFAGMYLGDLGAEVIRVGRVQGNSNPLASKSGPLDRGKRSINIDLKTETGAKIFLNLVKKSDVLLEGFRPGVAEKMGIGPDECLTCNPDLVYARMTGWGQEGPFSQTAGHDINYIALAGPLAHIGRKEQAPSVPLNLVGDFGGGSMFVISGILAALLAVKNGTTGQVVDAAMVDGAAYLASPLFAAHASGFWTDDRGSNLLDSGAPFYEVYETKCGEYVAVGAIEPQFYQQLLIGLKLASEELPPQNNREHWEETKQKFANIFLSKTREEWMSIFEGTDSCVTPVLTMGESPLHAHAVMREAFFESCGVAQPKPAPRFSKTPTSPHERSEDPGASTERILENSGYSKREISKFQADGIIS